MTQDFIAKMAKDLIRMCDLVEKHGLVDYQYGVAEEQIMMSMRSFFTNSGLIANRHTVLTECLDLQESLEGVGTNPGLGRAPP